MCAIRQQQVAASQQYLSLLTGFAHVCGVRQQQDAVSMVATVARQHTELEQLKGRLEEQLSAYAELQSRQ